MTNSGGTDLRRLLSSLQPVLLKPDYVFCTVADATHADFRGLEPLASFLEDEGLSLILEQGVADRLGLIYASVFRAITLSVHSSLDAIGLTAAVAGKLADHGISANVVAASYHDHIFVPRDKAKKALALLAAMSEPAPG